MNTAIDRSWQQSPAGAAIPAAPWHRLPDVMLRAPRLPMRRREAALGLATVSSVGAAIAAVLGGSGGI